MRAGLLLLTALALSAQSVDDPVEVLRQARPKLATVIKHLPRYTCVQTVERSYFRLGSGRERPTCAESAEWRRLNRRQVELTDRLRLEVAISESSEMYGWVGSGRFESKSLLQMVEGPIGTGAFGSFLVDIFGIEGRHFEFSGPEDLDGQSTLAYRFEVPQDHSTYKFEAAGETWITGYNGRFWLDHSGDLWRLRVRTTTPREDLHTCEADTSVDLHQVKIGTGEYLLPSESRFVVVGTGTESDNVTTYSGCREYHGESVLSFGDAPEEQQPSTSKTNGGDQDETKLPAGLQVVLALQTEVDWKTAAAGDAISAILRKDIVQRDPKRVLVPAGAIARGRLVRVAHQVKPPATFYLGINFETLELKGRTIPFSASLDPKEGPLRNFVVTVDQLAAERRSGPRPAPTLPPDAEISRGQTLVFSSPVKYYVLPRGYQTHWITRASSLSDRLR